MAQRLLFLQPNSQMEGGEERAGKRSGPPEPPVGYVCRLCSVPGHWIQVCPTKKTGSKKRKRARDHVFVAGKDPSPDDIDEARKLQAIPPPLCFCGLTSRLNKVKRSKVNDGSRAIGKYFFFCSKKRDDETQCRFARPVELEVKKQEAVRERAKKKRAEGGSKPVCKDKVVCKFFLKAGECKKGSRCKFKHVNVDETKADAHIVGSEKSSSKEDQKSSSSSPSSSSESSLSDSSSDEE
mmetsp:Transcript_20569/g.48317  ORF Transcript_20569/g.48317 Transcript_20569/m.48317 type:complete len:238 (+) Transcript_20569:248-961(+)